MGISEAGKSGKNIQAKYKAYDVGQDGKTCRKAQQGPEWHLERPAWARFNPLNS